MKFLVNITVLLILHLLATPSHSADRLMKTFILAGQSNMVGWGDSTKLPDVLRNGNGRVLMFEDGRWQPLRPHQPANAGQKRVGLTEFSFGPEIAFGNEMAKAWPDDTIGIIKLAVGGTSVLAWKPDWSKRDADRVGQGRHGSLFQKLMQKVEQAKKSRDIEILGLLWLQGGGDMKKVDVAKEYLANLSSIVRAVRDQTGVSELPFIYGSSRREGVSDDLSGLTPELMEGKYPAAQWVLKAQFDAQKAIARSTMVILRDIRKHPANVHYNTAGQLEVGKLFAQAFLDQASQPSRVQQIGGKTRNQILGMLGAKGDAGAEATKLSEYRRIFGFIDSDKDGNHSAQEFIEDGKFMTRQARQGIFQAADSNGDGIVSEQEYVLNRIITDEAKAIMARMDASRDSKISRTEFLDHSGLPERLAELVFNEFDTDENGELVIPEYLRVWGGWARGR